VLLLLVGAQGAGSDLNLCMVVCRSMEAAGSAAPQVLLQLYSGN
jgi:hypothetical protein